MLPIMLTPHSNNGETQKEIFDAEGISHVAAHKGSGTTTLTLRYGIPPLDHHIASVMESVDEIYAAIKTAQKEAAGYKKDASTPTGPTPEKKGPSPGPKFPS